MKLGSIDILRAMIGVNRTSGISLLETLKRVNRLYPLKPPNKKAAKDVLLATIPKTRGLGFHRVHVVGM